jgi:uncharacterized protein YdhG (YjbR/CyaY superfamily)
MNEIDKYIAEFPNHVQEKLEEIRAIIRKAAPKTEEVISYKMPAYKQNSVLVYFSGYKSHVGFYPTPSAIEAFKEEIKKYKWSKGAVQFPLDEPLPKKLIEQMVKFRMKQDAELAKAKKK